MSSAFISGASAPWVITIRHTVHMLLIMLSLFVFVYMHLYVWL